MQGWAWEGEGYLKLDTGLSRCFDANSYDAHPLYSVWRRDGLLRLDMARLEDSDIHKLLQVSSQREQKVDISLHGA